MPQACALGGGFSSGHRWGILGGHRGSCSKGYILGIEVIKNDTNLVSLLLDDIKPVCKFGFGNVMPFHWLSNQHNS